MERNSKWQSSSRNGVTMPLGIWGQFREATATSTKFSNKEVNFIHAEIEKLARKGVLEETKHSKNVFFSNFSLRKQKDVSYCLILNCACYSCKLCIIALQVIAQTTHFSCGIKSNFKVVFVVKEFKRIYNNFRNPLRLLLYPFLNEFDHCILELLKQQRERLEQR